MLWACASFHSNITSWHTFLSCFRYTEGDYHHLKKSKINRSNAVAELAKAHSMGASTDSDIIIIPENLRLTIPKPLKPSPSPPPSPRLSPIPLTPSPKPVRPLLREHPRSVSSHSMYREQHLTPPHHYSSLQKIQRAYSDDRSFHDARSHSQLRNSHTMEETMRRSMEDASRSMDDPLPPRRPAREDSPSRHRYKEDSPSRRSSRQEDRVKLYTQERARSCAADMRTKSPMDSRSHTSLQIPGSGDDRDEPQQPRSRLRRPSIGEIKAISPTLTRRINERVPYIKKQRSMSEDLPMSPLVHTQKYSSRESLPAYSQQHQVFVEVHHEPPPTRFFPQSPSRLIVKSRDPHQSRSFELQSVSSKDVYVQRRVKSYEISERDTMEINHDRLEITQFMRGAMSNANFDTMEPGACGELKSKVRYNDTGSLEDLNDSVPIDEIVTETLTVDDSETETCSTLNGQNPKYKDLWSLRATLEEEEDLSDTIRMEDMITSPDEQSPEEKDPGTSYTTSFESNTEPVIDPENMPSDHPGDDFHVASSNLLKPHQNRRQTYRTILNKRVKQTQSGQTSLDSMETDGEVSDTSRHEVTTTSFESTTGTDNTDSTGDGSNASKLQQMRGDSGYKSLETQQSQGQNDLYNKPPKKQIQFIIDKDGAAEGETSTKEKSPQRLSPQAAVPTVAIVHHHKSSKHSTFDRRNGKTASKKRRDFHSERKAAAAVKVYESIEQEPESDSHSDKPSGDSFDAEPSGQQGKKSLFSRFIKAKPSKKPSLARDYSIDSKTDALFHEFLRHDPVLECRGLHPPRFSDTSSSSVPASFDMTGGGRRDRLSPTIRSASLGSDKPIPQTPNPNLLSVSPQASIEEEDEDPEEDERRRYKRRLSASRRRSMSESAASALAALQANIPVIKLHIEDDEP